MTVAPGQQSPRAMVTEIRQRCRNWNCSLGWQTRMHPQLRIVAFTRIPSKYPPAICLESGFCQSMNLSMQLAFLLTAARYGHSIAQQQRTHRAQVVGWRSILIASRNPVAH